MTSPVLLFVLILHPVTIRLYLLKTDVHDMSLNLVSSNIISLMLYCVTPRDRGMLGKDHQVD